MTDALLRQQIEDDIRQSDALAERIKLINPQDGALDLVVDGVFVGRVHALTDSIAITIDADVSGEFGQGWVRIAIPTAPDDRDDFLF